MGSPIFPPSSGGSGSGTSDHSQLTNRTAANQHPGSSISLDTTGFDNNLSSADDTVQKALETLDELSAAGLPVVDTTAIVKDQTDATKLVRIDAGTVATGTTRVITMPNQDIDLTPGTGTFEGAIGTKKTAFNTDFGTASGTTCQGNDSRIINWIVVTGTSQSASVGYGYIANNSSLVTITLPASASVGNIIRVSGLGAGGWKVAQNSGQQIIFGNLATTPGTSGYIASQVQYDAVELLCVVANTTFLVISNVGNITVI